MDLKGKKILFIGIGFYDYEVAIREELIRKGANQIDYFSSVYNSLLCRIFQRLNMNKKVEQIRTSYIQKRLFSFKENYDYVLIIKAEWFNEDNLKVLKQRFSSAKIIIYLWDSLERHINGNILLKYFKKDIFTFDRVDALNKGLKFRPLFFRENMSDRKNNETLYDLSFIGWIHSDRYELIKKIKEYCIRENLQYKFILFIGRWTFLLNRYLKCTINKEDVDLFCFSPLPYQSYIEISKSSNVILDISHPNQKGLTMRTIESIGMGKKILTTNADIKEYSYIDSSQYHIIDRYNMEIPRVFFNDDYIQFKPYPDLSLSSFIDELLKNKD